MTKEQVLNMWEKNYKEVETMKSKMMEISSAYCLGEIDKEECDRRIEEIEKVYKVVSKCCTDLLNLYLGM